MSHSRIQKLHEEAYAEKQAMILFKLNQEKMMVTARTGLGDMPDRLLDDFGFAVNRLHDPCNFDHTTLKDMLDTYHFRDLEKSKLFRIAKKIFGDKMDSKFRIRTRTFNLSGLASGQPGKVIFANYGLWLIDLWKI